MRFDHLAEERQEKHFTIWVQALLRKEPEYLAMQLAAAHYTQKPVAARRWKNGAFNVCYQVRYEDGFEAIVRFAALGRVVFRTEKVENEVAVMNYLRQYTSIPVPRVLGFGKSWPGSYIVMEYIEGEQLSNFLKDQSVKERPVLNPQISGRALKRAYKEMAGLMLELSKPEFSRIGALEQNGADFTVSRRPFTFNLNELSISANLPPEKLLVGTFDSAADYFEALAKQHLAHLWEQRNDSVLDETDCRKKFVARCLFLRLSRNISQELSHGPFRLYCDDFRPSNILLDTKNPRIAAAIDWEFTYVAPAEFTYVAPWWLLLQNPEDWEDDLNEFLNRYVPRFHLFLDALRDCETEKIGHGTLAASQRLSPQMEQSLENGLFWFCLAARYSSMFDEIYWEFIDKKFYGPFESIEDRMGLLSESERREGDDLVRLKLEQSVEEPLNDCYSSDKLVDL